MLLVPSCIVGCSRGVLLFYLGKDTALVAKKSEMTGTGKTVAEVDKGSEGEEGDEQGTGQQ